MPTIYRLGLGTSRVLRLFVLLLGVPYKRLRLLRQKIDIMHQTSVDIFNAKRKAMQEGVDGDHKDFLSILSASKPTFHVYRALSDARFTVHENAKASKEDQLPDHEVIAQISYVYPPSLPTYR